MEFIPSFTNNKFVTTVTNQSYQHRSQCRFQFSNRGCWFGFNGHGCCYQHYSYEPYPTIPHLPTTDTIPTELPALRDIIINMMEKLKHILAQLNASNNIDNADDIPLQSPAFIPSQRRSRSKRKRTPRNTPNTTRKSAQPKTDPITRKSPRNTAKVPKSITPRDITQSHPKSRGGNIPTKPTTMRGNTLPTTRDIAVKGQSMTLKPTTQRGNKSTTPRGNTPSTTRENQRQNTQPNKRSTPRRNPNNPNKNKKKKAPPNKRPKSQKKKNKKKKKTPQNRQRAFAAAFGNIYDDNIASSDPQPSDDDTKQFMLDVFNPNHATTPHNQTMANIQRLSRKAATQSRPLSIKDTYDVVFDRKMTSSDSQPCSEDDAEQPTIYDENPQLIMNAFRLKGKPEPTNCEEAYGDIYIYATHYAQYCFQQNITDQRNASKFIIWALRTINEKFSIKCEDTEAITNKYNKISQPLGIDLIWEIIKEINAKLKINGSWIS